MQNNNTTFLQKLKDNAFYVALGLGLLAILAVVAIYTVEQSDSGVAENEIDLNKASDYSVITSESDDTAVANARTANQSGIETRDTQIEMADEDTIDEDSADIDENAETSETSPVTSETSEVVEETKEIAASANVAELTFTSDQTIDWPVEGKVILPYSMETTVYFKTLDQYQCNPGMLIAAGSGTTIKNAFYGKVTEVTSDNIYGNMVTVSIGNDYSIVYGQLDTVYLKEGDYVKAGDSVGTVGNPTDSFAEEGTHLFFQMLDGEQAIDPMMFIE